MKLRLLIVLILLITLGTANEHPIQKIKNVYSWVSSDIAVCNKKPDDDVKHCELYQTKLIENANSASAPAVGNYSSVTNFYYEWTGGEPWILRFITRSHAHGAREYYEEYLFTEKGELLFALKVDEFKINRRYYFDSKKLIRVMVDKKIYDLDKITQTMQESAAETLEESKALLTAFNSMSNLT